MSEKIQKIKEEINFYVKNNRSTVLKAGVCVFLFAVAAFLFFSESGDEDAEVISETVTGSAVLQEEVVEEYIYVDVEGAVNMPGVVKLPSGSRVFEAIAAAGGLKSSGDNREINLAASLQDGDKIYIPDFAETDALVQSENRGGIVSSSGTSARTGKINLNTASSEELQQLPGVGPAMAERIIDYRTTAGRFQNIKELMNVSGIGEKTFQKLEEKIEI